MGKSSVPEAPDLTEFTDALTEASQMSYQIAQDQLAWAQEQYAHDSAITDQVTADFLEQSDWAFQAAQEDRARQQEVFQPVEDQLAAQAEYYATPEYKRQQMGAAAATTAQQVNQAVQASSRELASYGVNPDAGKMAGTDIATRTGGAAATAAGATQAAEATDAKALALASDVANLGKGYPASSTAYLSAAGQGAGGAASATNAGTTTASNAMTAPAGYITAGTSALSSAGDITNQGYQNQIYAAQVNNQASSGWGTALGSLAGIATQFIPQPPTIIQTVHEGGAIQAQGGGAIPVAASPSRGAVTDDVPIMGEAGEFMIPKRAVEWFGQKFFHDQIAKADKQKAEVAQGQQAAVPAGTSAPAGNSPQSTPRPVSAVNPAANKPVDQTAFDFARQGAAYMQQRNQPQSARAQTGLGSPPVVGPRAPQSRPARIPVARPAVPTYAPSMPPGMAAGGAVAHYLPPGQAITAAHPRPLMRPMAPRLSPTVRMPAPGVVPISPTASPMVRSIRGMADGGTVDPGYFWNPNTGQWESTQPIPRGSANAITTYHDDVVPGASAVGPVAQSVPGLGGSAPSSGNVYVPPSANMYNPPPPVAAGSVRPGYQPGFMGTAPPPVAPGSVHPGWQPGNMAYAAPPPGIFPYSRTPPPYGVGQQFGMGAPPPYGVGQQTMGPPPPYGVGLPEMNYAPPPYGVGLPESAVIASRSSPSRSGKSRGSGSSKSSARKPKSRPDSKSTKKQPIIRENYPNDMTAFEFARQGQDYLRGKPYRATAALPSARSK